MKKYYLFLGYLFFSIVFSYSQSDCNSALNLCTNANTGGVVKGLGNDDFNGRLVLGCLDENLEGTYIESNSYWFRVKLTESGQFGFNIEPNNPSEDWDFGVFGPNATCGELGTPVRCNYIGGSGGYTGVGVDPSTGTQTGFYDAWINANAGDEYVVYVNQYNGTNAGFSITWEGAVFDDGADALDCSILVDLGPDRELCVGSAGTVLNATIFGADVSYEWFLENPATGAFEPMDPVQKQSTYFVSSTGHYQVKVIDSATGDEKGDTIVVAFSEVPIANPASDMILCDFDGSGNEKFDLELQTNIIIGSQLGMIVTYHKSKVFAQAGAAPIVGLFESSGDKVWARIENSANGSCWDITSFNLYATLPPRAVQPLDLRKCDDDTDGEMIFDLTTQTSIILDGQTGLVVTYYKKEEHANDPKAFILDPNIFPSKSQTIWARVETLYGSDCYALTSFELEVLDSPIANVTIDLQQCDDNNDGYYSFDLNALKDAEILGAQNPSTYTISYYNLQANAVTNTNALPNPYTNATPYSLETIYARITNVGSSICYDITSFTVQVFDSAFPPLPSEIIDFSVCDDTSDGDDTNGFYSFNLTDYDTILLNEQSSFVFDVDYYEDPAYMNPIGNPIAYINIVADRQTIYVRVTNSNPNNTTCFSDTSFDVEVRPLPNALSTPFNFIQCDEDGIYDDIVEFNLAEADTFLTLGNTAMSVSYYLTPIDAAEGIKEQPKFPFSNATYSQLYGRVEATNGCYRIVPVNLIVSANAFPPGYSRELIECDDDAVIDGLHVFNLAQTTSEIISLFESQNLQVSFYRSQNDALLESNRISPSDTYLSEVPFSQTILVRVEGSLDGGCFGIAPVIQLTVNPRPEFELDDSAIVCLNNLPLTVTTYNPNDFYTYKWTDNSGKTIGEQPFATITQGGIYTVVATSNLGCVSFPKTIDISESNIAVIEQDDVIITDNSTNNSITIITANQNLGIGDYEFSLNNNLGPYQDNPTFSNVIPGEYTIYVRDKNSCGVAQIVVYVLGFPNFFTPNNDNQNDTWQVRGVDQAVFPQSTVLIYDRYGKLLSTFDTNHIGWDGTYANIEAISSDYWYSVELVDITGSMRHYRGHFSLLRK